MHGWVYVTWNRCHKSDVTYEYVRQKKAHNPDILRIISNVKIKLMRMGNVHLHFCICRYVYIYLYTGLSMPVTHE